MMITLILPIIIISIMLFVAFVAACILYRKRRIGKMNMEEDGRQSYGNKGNVFLEWLSLFDFSVLSVC